MSLRNSESRYNSFGEFEHASISLFVKAETRLKNKKAAIEDLQNEYDLLEKQAFELYKTHVNYWQFGKTLIEKTQKWMNMLEKGIDANGNKIDKRKRYEEKDCYEYVVALLKDLLGVEDFSITQIMDYNWGEAKCIYFTSHDHTWELFIPTIDGIKMKTYQNYGVDCFKLKLLHEDSKSYYSWVGNTFEEEKLKDIMQSGIDKWVKNES